MQRIQTGPIEESNGPRRALPGAARAIESGDCQPAGTAMCPWILLRVRIVPAPIRPNSDVLEMEQPAMMHLPDGQRRAILEQRSLAAR